MLVPKWIFLIFATSTHFVMAEQRRGPRAATSVRLLDLPVAWRVLLAPIAALATLAIWLQYAFLALMCDCQPKRQRINALVLLYQARTWFEAIVAETSHSSHS